MEQEYESDVTPQPTSRKSIGTLRNGFCGRVMGQLCGHGECNMINGPEDRTCKTCKGKPPH